MNKYDQITKLKRARASVFYWTGMLRMALETDNDDEINRCSVKLAQKQEELDIVSETSARFLRVYGQRMGRRVKNVPDVLKKDEVYIAVEPMKFSVDFI